MPIVGVSLTSIEAARRSVPHGEVKVNSGPKIIEVKEATLESLGKKALSMKFEFVTDYQPDVGRIRMEGEMIYLADDNAKVLAQWKKEKSLPEKTSVEVLNQLFRKCLLKASNIAEDLQLPVPLQMPTVAPKKK